MKSPKRAPAKHPPHDKAAERHDEAAAKIAAEVAEKTPAHEPSTHAMPPPQPVPDVMTGGLDANDTRSHVERINP